MTAPPLPLEIVTQPARLEAAIAALLDAPAIALDTESNSFHHYPEQLCLIQIATHRQVYIVDTIVLPDIAPLSRVLEDRVIEKVVHGADYDIRSLDRHCGCRVRNLYDTNIAARFAGLARVGLGALLEDLLGVVITKSKRLQRADWGRRPLSAEALDYAASDVRHLFDLREVLDGRLRALGRAEWVAEECARLEEVRYTPPDTDNAYLSIKGARRLDGRGLAILRRLCLFREEEARRETRPPFYIMSDETLVFLASQPTTPLDRVPGLGPVGRQRFGNGLQQALREGLAAPPPQRAPVQPVAWPTRRERERLDGLKAWRTGLGATLALDPSLLWPMASLERLSRAPDSLAAELASGEVRRWQAERFADSLRARLRSLS